jgi:hypothetical protein
MHPLTCVSIDLKLELTDEALDILLSPAKPGPWRQQC